VVRCTRAAPSVRVLFDPAGAATELEAASVVVLDDPKPSTPTPLLTPDLLSAFVAILQEPCDVDVPAEESSVEVEVVGDKGAAAAASKASPPPTPVAAGGDDAHPPPQPSIATLAGEGHPWSHLAARAPRCGLPRSLLRGPSYHDRL
jgi:hypothetical protein